MKLNIPVNSSQQNNTLLVDQACGVNSENIADKNYSIKTFVLSGADKPLLSPLDAVKILNRDGSLAFTAPERLVQVLLNEGKVFQIDRDTYQFRDQPITNNETNL